jgi:predicted dehydrogenase
VTKRYGLIGCGGAGVNRHLSNAVPNPRLSPRAVCDLDEAVARSTAAEFNLSAYTDAREMIETESLDAVSVATPPGTHHGVVTEIAPTGVDFLVEKPFARTLANAEEMLAACEKSGSAVTEVNNQLFRPLVRWVTERVQNGYVGDVNAVISYVGVNDAAGADTVKTDWVTEIDGERFGEDMEHRIYLTRNFIGDITDASLVDSVTEIEGLPYDTAEATALVRAGDASGYLTMSFRSSCPNIFLIIGTRRTLLMDMSSRIAITLDKPNGGSELLRGNFENVIEILSQSAKRAGIHGRTVALRKLADFGITLDGAYATSGHYQQLSELARGDPSRMTVTPDDIRNNAMAYERIIDEIVAEK